MGDLRESLNIFCAHLHDVYHKHEDPTYRIYYRLYYEVIKGYLERPTSLQPLIANVIEQIGIRLPWATGSEFHALTDIREGLTLLLEKHVVDEPLDKFSSIYE